MALSSMDCMATLMELNRKAAPLGLEVHLFEEDGARAFTLRQGKKVILSVDEDHADYVIRLFITMNSGPRGRI